ncbi:SFT2 domain containing 2a isoform X1 [Oncorhynchus kisutch]|uniref:Vesicle transport protein n=1 Tax=Oncorhynchus kisutch TaxID=8019 RepID=A0A8C7DVI7_ONCKI|nr:vesicle transport protein SFT2B isoform X1 [Oncorhynchus kisutch]
MDKLKSVLSGTDGPNENGNILQAANEASTLGWGTRVKGFIICFVIGVTCSILGVCMLFIPKVGILLFIIFYTFGNICSLCSTMFLMGPVKQLKRMCDKTRALATTIMLTCLVLTLCAAFWVWLVIYPFYQRCHPEDYYHVCKVKTPDWPVSLKEQLCLGYKGYLSGLSFMDTCLKLNVVLSITLTRCLRTGQPTPYSKIVLPLYPSI